jgi:hypothetical protein
LKEPYEASPLHSYENVLKNWLQKYVQKVETTQKWPQKAGLKELVYQKANFGAIGQVDAGKSHCGTSSHPGTTSPSSMHQDIVTLSLRLHRPMLRFLPSMREFVNKARLAYTLGIKQLIFAVSNMDLSLFRMLLEMYVPMSGFVGETAILGFLWDFGD